MRRYRTDNRLDITKYEITTDNAHLSAPLTIALIADLHDRPYEKIMAALSEDKPDIIVIAGDLVDGYTADGWNEASQGLPVRMPESVFAKSLYALRFLKACAVLAPTYYGLGNHEWLLSKYDYELIKNTGITLLDNTSTSKTPCSVTIGGLTSSRVMRHREYILQHPDLASYYPLREHRPWWQRRRSMHPHLDYEWLDHFCQQDGFKILLCHHPEYWAYKDPILSEMNIDLTLAGHAHGGQIRIFNHGIFAPGQGLLPKYTEGIYRGKYGNLIVSRGLANTTPFPRFNNRPEMIFVTLL